MYPVMPAGRVRGTLACFCEVCMAKGPKREYVWLECTSCGDRNYRTEVSVAAGAPKLELKKFCRRERTRTVHKLRRK